MSEFLKEYGGAILIIVVIFVLIVMTTPVGEAIEAGIKNAIGNLTGVVSEDSTEEATTTAAPED